MNRKLTTNSRLVNELFANYISTFTAFCELMNNSIQAKSKNIWIDIDYTSDEEIHPLIIKKITIKDDGVGVHISDIERKLLDIGTANKDGGKGIGRFASFQIGQKVEIETVSYSKENNNFTKVYIPLTFDSFGKNINVSEVEIDTKEKILKGNNHNPYYKVTISNLYDSNITDNEPKKKIIDKFLSTNIADAIFERYPLKIFNNDIKFCINGKNINPNDFVLNKPIKKIFDYTDTKGKVHKILFDFMQIKKYEKIKVFLTTQNAGLNTIANGFEYDASWLSPKIGGWFIYIASATLSADIYRNIDLDDLDDNWKKYREFIKENLNDFYRERNIEFDNFSDKLKGDEYYPYKIKSSSKSKVILFDKLAYLVEDKYHILNENNKLREIIYPLIDRTISNGELNKILGSILKLNSKMISKFSDLLEKTDLENIIEFSDKVSSKIEDIEFLEKLVYSEISKNVKERKELHKFLEKMLWVFGEEYNETTKLLSDKNLEKNLTQLRDDYLVYKPSKADNNSIEITERTVKSITDLFMYNERIIDHKKREVLIVELKAPKVKISPKEIGQVMKYAREIEKLNALSKNINYKILLISSGINSDAQFDITGRQKNEDNPYFYFRNENKNIEIWIMNWSDLIENVKRKLKYMANVLETKDIDVQDKAKRDFENIEFGKTSSTLKKVAV
ncbi:ATP-binding protein [Flavobacterium frigoris]|uniref:Histidine kinase-, DNA gyrase B-, and HSP90-like ATPase n=1 Tax=Flavobacterium frigoris TaxID=229204 RepID=A0A1H9HUR2_FLAFI|nr:ATP-binding protein [Flavobacterium frigoris]SEQ66071.1 Histidine kinase-, DNA gyrase B-, and HSP90-like ATPase [Flavobacterium frigoris]